jgi:hypothetical protein
MSSQELLLAVPLSALPSCRNQRRNLPPRLQLQCPGGQAVTRFDLEPGFSHDEAAQSSCVLAGQAA